jgi:glycosyltransferase involved in cell wall biosynthesis
MVVVANGFDTVAFQPNVQARESVRRNLNIGRNEIVVGCVARWDPQKDHRTLFSALSLLKARGQRLRCICAGSDMVDSNNELSRLIRRRGLQDDVLLLGPWSDVAGLMNALDVHVMSSAYGEAFPNVLAEAMACGIPCVTTDVGDARAIIGDTGWVVLPRDPAALADALSEAIAERGREDRRRRSRERVESQFTLGRMASGFVEVWTSALGGHS